MEVLKKPFERMAFFVYETKLFELVFGALWLYCEA